MSGHHRHGRHRRLAAPLAAILAAVTVSTFTVAQARDSATQAPPPKDYPAVPLLSTGKTIVGETIAYPRTGPAHITAAIVTLAPGGRTVLHKHGAPLFAYILEGELTVDYGRHGKRTFRTGDTLMEAMAVPHFGVNTGTAPMRLIGVYMGAKGTRDVIPAK
ncbi:MAG TPA: cupin domain-containing protein [Pseudolabrys sp.]|nr:cupin domain-containing protein [Pseudolabrys sp.]